MAPASAGRNRRGRDRRWPCARSSGSTRSFATGAATASPPAPRARCKVVNGKARLVKRAVLRRLRRLHRRMPHRRADHRGARGRGVRLRGHPGPRGRHRRRGGGAPVRGGGAGFTSRSNAAGLSSSNPPARALRDSGGCPGSRMRCRSSTTARREGGGRRRAEAGHPLRTAPVARAASPGAAGRPVLQRSRDGRDEHLRSGRLGRRALALPARPLGRRRLPQAGRHPALRRKLGAILRDPTIPKVIRRAHGGALLRRADRRSRAGTPWR